MTQKDIHRSALTQLQCVCCVCVVWGRYLDYSASLLAPPHPILFSQSNGGEQMFLRQVQLG